MRNEGFSLISLKLTEHTDEIESSSNKKLQDDTEATYKQIFNEILDVAIVQISETFANFDALSFVSLSWTLESLKGSRIIFLKMPCFDI